MRQSPAVFSQIVAGSVRFVDYHPLREELNDRLGNTRVISQTALDHFRTSLASKKDDPYSVLLRRNKLPMSLLDDAANPNNRKVNYPPPTVNS